MMGEDFSDAPLTVNGVTVNPTWPWSKEYRLHVADGMRRTGRSDLSPKEIKARYVAWYAQEHGLGLDEARAKVRGEA